MTLATVEFITYGGSVTEVLDRIGAGRVLAGQPRILIKPNLVCAAPYPVTTPPQCCAALIDYIRAHNPSADIVIAEGPGDPSDSTMRVFEALGYVRMAAEKKIRLVDLNAEPAVRLENPACRRWPELYFPQIALSHFILSVPVLKAHTLSKFTGTMKNMMGFAPPSHYAGDGSWNKAAFHRHLQEAILDINRHRHPDLSLMDAVVGLAGSHLGGRRCDPPVGRLIAGDDPVELDRHAADCLGLDWRRIGHLRVNLQDRSAPRGNNTSGENPP